MESRLSGPTLDSLEPGDLKKSGGKNSRLRMAQASFKGAMAAGVPLPFASGAVGDRNLHGLQAMQFAYFVKWGETPVQALQMAFSVAAQHGLNYGWSDRVGTIAGKFADLIAVSGDPLADVSRLEHVQFCSRLMAITIVRALPRLHRSRRR